jgi:hypothetical protein
MLFLAKALCEIANQHSQWVAPVTSTWPNRLLRYFLLVTFLGLPLVQAQTGDAVLSKQTQPPVQTSNGVPCLKPAPLFSAEDYEGPLKKVLVYFSRKPEIKTVHPPRHIPGSVFCALEPAGKFHLFLQDTLEPVTFVGAAYDAGLSQAQDDDHSFGQGAAGYGKRYGAALTDQVSDGFFNTFLYPTVFREDPRYYRQLEGSTRMRMGHAISHVFVAQNDSGRKMVNFSEWFGRSSSVALSNLYHPGNRRGFEPSAVRVSLGVGSDIGFDVLREFWPEIVRKLKLPFRQRDYAPVAP